MTSSLPRRCLLLGVLAAGLAVGAPVAPRAAAGESASSPATLVAGWKDLGAAGTKEAAARITAAYRAQKDETLRGLLVTTVCAAARTDAALDVLRDWRLASTETGDVWLWYRTLVREYERDPAAARAAVVAEVKPELRAAAIRALAAWADPEALDFAPAAVRRQWGEGKAGALLVEAWAAVVASQPGRSSTQPFRSAVLAIAEYVETQAPEARTKLEVARALGRAFETDEISTDPRVWRSLLERVDAHPDHRHDGHTAGATASFFDLDATGDRIVYLLDASGSMDEPLPAATLDALRSLGRSDRSSVTKAPPIDWARVRTARQAVTEVTKASLRTLPPTLSFCVVLFGSDARTLASTPGLVQATGTNVTAACKDLDAARRESHRGTTNLHGGLRKAFGVTLSGTGDGRSVFGADPLTTLAAGATTMFVLTDGVPSRDDWDDTANLVTGKPWYADVAAIVEDVTRMNLLRGCEVHAVALGTESRRVLEPLTRVGGGHVRVVEGAGRDAPPAPEPEAESCPLPFGPLRRAVEDLLPRLTTADAPAARDGLHGLLPQAKTAHERVWIAARLAKAGDRRELETLLAGLEDPSDQVAAWAVEGLEALARRSFGPATGLDRAGRTSLRRNWTWWWERQPK
ncbi:MAG: hypothetical protein U1E39_06845 [Planctomycetota bacterium]